MHAGKHHPPDDCGPGRSHEGIQQVINELILPVILQRVMSREGYSGPCDDCRKPTDHYQTLKMQINKVRLIKSNANSLYKG